MEYIKNVAKIKIDQGKCTGCKICLNVCPHEVIDINNGRAYITNKDACIECGACDKNCPTEAILVESGVGCAYAVLNSWLSDRKSKSKCC